MGTFAGHAIPGSFFLIFALWWTLQIFRRYYGSLLKNGPKFQSSVTFQCACLPGRLKYWEIEGFLKIFFCAVGITGELITAFDDEGNFAYIGNGQHATMFSFFAFSGVIDILVNQNFPLPKGIEYIVSIAAFTAEAFLFKFHLEGRDGLDILLHTLLLYTIIATIMTGIAEVRYRDSVLVALCRTFFVFVQGTWFWQVGWILYPPTSGGKPWQPDDHQEKLLATMIFVWHMAVALVTMLTIGGIVGCVYRRRHGPFDLFQNPYDALEMHLVQKNSNGHTVINLRVDSESDIEFEQPIIRRENGLS